MIRKTLALIIVFCLVFSIASCVPNSSFDNGGSTGDNTDNNGSGSNDSDGNDSGNTSDQDSGETILNHAEYTVTVKGPLGQLLSGVTVFVHLDNGEDYNVCLAPAVTDKNGSVTFTLDATESYSVGLTGFPGVFTAKDGNTRETRYALDSQNTEITLGVRENYNPKMYSLGGYMADFTITDINGNEYGLYDLLAEKKAVVLNFWFCGCGPCASEFPALNKAYNSYKDKLEVLAINDHPQEGYDSVVNYETVKGFDLDMPLFKVGYGSAVSLSRFKSQGYPTTVIIDRYGKICVVHVGAMTSTEQWEKLFAFYTSDSYTQS